VLRIRQEDLPIRLEGRIVGPEDLEFLRSFIAANPYATRTQLADDLCRLWSWNKPNGTPRTASARVLLLRLHDSGLLQLPMNLQKRQGVKRPRSTPSLEQNSMPTTAQRPKKTPCIREQDLPLRLVGHIVGPEDLEFLRSFVAANPGATRTQLANDLCRLWSWNKPNGTPKTISAYQLLLRLHDSGLLQLPPAMRPFPNQKRIIRTPAGEPRPTRKFELSDLLPLQLQRVVTQADHDLWRELIDRYHYLGFTTGAGAQIRYFVHSPQGIVALFGFGASAWHVKDRDQWIGWNKEHRYQFRHLIVNNSRFLILPWIKCQNLASKLLSLVVRTLPRDWQTIYNYTPVLLETFVDQSHFWGTAYKAANWKLVGLTQGQGKKGPKRAILPLKAIYLYPLTKNFRLILTGRKNPG